MTALTPGADVERAVVEFLYHEARLLDDQRYAEWEDLWHEDGVYWVPLGDGDYDPEQHLSVIYDDRINLSKRVARLLSGDAHSQDPPSRVSRLLSNITAVKREDELHVTSRFLATEFRTDTTFWAGRIEHVLTGDEGAFQIRSKTVFLVNSDGEMPLLAFIL